MMAVTESRLARVVTPLLHPFLMLVPATCLTAGLLTDIAYWVTVHHVWADFSAWIVSAGAILAWLVAMAGFVELLVRPALHRGRAIAVYSLAYLAAMTLATFNMLVHTRDAWVSVVPWGIVLSASTVIAFLVAAGAAYILFVCPRTEGVSR